MALARCRVAAEQADMPMCLILFSLWGWGWGWLGFDMGKEKGEREGGDRYILL